MPKPCCVCLTNLEQETSNEADCSRRAASKSIFDEDLEVVVDIDVAVGHENEDPEPVRPFECSSSVLLPTRESLVSSTTVVTSLSLSSSSLATIMAGGPPSPTPPAVWSGGPGPGKFGPAALVLTPQQKGKTTTTSNFKLGGRLEDERESEAEEKSSKEQSLDQREEAEIEGEEQVDVKIDALENMDSPEENPRRQSQYYESEIGELPKFGLINRFADMVGASSKDTKGSHAASMASPRQTETSTIRSYARIFAPPTTTFDLVPELTSFAGCGDLLRGTRLATILRARNNVLRASPGSEATFKLSQEVDRLDVFLSHNWCNSWLMKCLALVHHFNFGAAALATLVVLAIIFALTVAGYLPTLPQQSGDSAGFVARLVTVPCFFLFLFLFQDMKSALWHAPRPSVFLDKTCISQTNPALQRRGIEKLSAFLSNSDIMLALWSDEYLTKLWTVYEVAAFLALRPSRCMIVLPLRLIVVHYLTILWTWFLGLCFLVIRAATHYSWVLESFLILLFCTFMCAASRVWALVARNVNKSLSTFDVKHCSCAREEDRELVSRNIAVLMRIRGECPCATDAEALEMFNELARYELPGVFTSCLHPVALQYKQMLLWSTLWYGTIAIDEIGSKIADGLPLYEAACQLVPEMFWVVLVLPLAASLTQRVTMFWIDQKGWWTYLRLAFCYTVLVNFPTSSLGAGGRMLAEVSQQNPMGWIGLAALTGVTGVAVRWSFTAPLGGCFPLSHQHHNEEYVESSDRQDQTGPWGEDEDSKSSLG